MWGTDSMLEVPLSWKLLHWRDIMKVEELFFKVPNDSTIIISRYFLHTIWILVRDKLVMTSLCFLSWVATEKTTFIYGKGSMSKIWSKTCLKDSQRLIKNVRMCSPWRWSTIGCTPPEWHVWNGLYSPNSSHNDLNWV